MAFESRKSDSRRSSILKPRKQRHPLQNVNFNASSNENSPGTSKIKRRVSFAEKKHVKEFCHSIEQGTVWDNTYEEHDSSLKGSSIEQNTETEIKENFSECTSENNCTNITVETGSNYINNSNIKNNQLCMSTVGTDQDDNNTGSYLNFVNPVENIHLSSEECSLQPTVVQNISAHISHNATSNYIVYVDTDEEDCMSNMKPHSKSCTNSELDQTCNQDLSIKLTKGIPVSSLFSDSNIENNKHKYIHKGNVSCQNNCFMNYATSCNNMSMEITEVVSTSAKFARSNVEISKQVPVMLPRNSEDVKSEVHTVKSNIHTDTTIFSKSTEIQDTNSNDDSMELTGAIQTLVPNTNECSKIDNRNCIDHNSIKIPKIVVSEVYEKNTTYTHNNSECITKDNNLYINQQMSESINKYEICNNILTMEMTKPVNITLPTNVCNEENLQISKRRDDKNIYFCDTFIAVNNPSSNDEQKVAKSSIVSDKKDILLNSSMELTEAVSVPLCREITSRIIYATHVAEPELSQTTLSSHLPTEYSKSFPLQTNAVANTSRIFDNVPMEMIEIFPSRNEEEITNAISWKSLSKKNTRDEQDLRNSITFNAKTRLLNKSMDLTEAVSVPLCREKTCIIEHAVRSSESILPQGMSSSHLFTEYSKNLPLQTNAVANTSRIFDNVPMEITDILPSRNEQEITNVISCKSLSKKNTRDEQDLRNSITFNEKTRLLNKSMDLTEAVPVPLCRETTSNTLYAVQSTEPLLSQTISSSYLPTGHSIDLPLQTNANTSTSGTIHNITMEMNTALPSVAQVIQDVLLNENVTSKDDGQRLSINVTNSEYLTESIKNITESNFTTSKGTIDICVKALNTDNTPILLDNMDCSSSVTMENINNRKKQSCENENIHSKKKCNSLTKSEYYEDDNTHLSLKADNYRNDNASDESLAVISTDFTQVPNQMTSSQISKSKLNDSLNKISECSLLRKSLSYLKNDLSDLQSIKPPSFVCMNSEEENSFLDGPRGKELQSVTTTDAILVNDENNSFNQSEPINIEYNETESHENVTLNKVTINRETEFQVIVCTVANDNQTNESDSSITNAEINADTDRENVLAISNISPEKTTFSNTRCFIKPKEIDEDRIKKKEYIGKSISECTTKVHYLHSKEKVYSDISKKRLKLEQYIDCPQETEVIIDLMNPEKYYERNLNDNANLRSMQQKEECTNAENKSEMEQCADAIQNESLTKEDPFLALLQQLEMHAESDDCIWNIYYKNIDRKMIAFGFMSNSLLIVTFLSDELDCSEENSIKGFKIISRLSPDDGQTLIRIVHRLILERINEEILTCYKTHEDILSMLEFVSQDVKLAMDFMFDLKRLDSVNLMDITCNEILFVSRSKQMDIILKIIINVKRFDKLTPGDINVHCLLGTIKEADVKNLIKGIKKDHMFLRRYMNDVKDYIDIMEEVSKPFGV